MSYLVIARKYRPQRFSDVVGQEHVTQTLANAIAMGRIAHAYLFCGPRGTGKTTIARIFAKCLNCTNGPRVDFDDNDPRCKEIAEGSSLDVIEIDGASNNGVEQVRQLREAVRYAPAVSRYKIYIIDEVHMLSQGAFNALLKTLEEPPPHVIFMFATTDPEKIPPTVLSRCQRYDLRRIPVKLIVNHLAKIAKAEGVEIETGALYAIARSSDGCMRDAEGMLDQLISFCGNKIKESDVLSMFGITSGEKIAELAQAIIDNKPDKALQILNELSSSGKEMTRLISDVLSYFRNLLIIKVSAGDTSLIEATEEELKRYQEQAKQLSADAITRIMEIFAECETGLRNAVSRKILVEISIIKAIEARSAVRIDSVLKQLQTLREEAASGKFEVETVRADERGVSSQPVQQKPQTVKDSEESKAVKQSVEQETEGEEQSPAIPSDLAELWGKIISAAERESIFFKAFLSQCSPVSFENNVLKIAAPAESGSGIFGDDKGTETLLKILNEAGYKATKVEFIGVPLEEIKVAKPKAKPVQQTKEKSEKPVVTPPVLEHAESEQELTAEDFKNDPKIKEALERFKGRIAAVIPKKSNSEN